MQPERNSSAIQMCYCKLHTHYVNCSPKWLRKHRSQSFGRPSDSGNHCDTDLIYMKQQMIMS